MALVEFYNERIVARDKWENDLSSPASFANRPAFKKPLVSLQIDEDFLRRITTSAGSRLRPTPILKNWSYSAIEDVQPAPIDRIECGGSFVLFVGATAKNLSASVISQTGFLQKLYKVDAKLSSRHAVNVIIDHVDDLLNEGEFEECAALLDDAEVDKLSNSAIVTFLGITLAAKGHPRLKSSRDKFFSRAIAAVANRRGEDGAATLLDKYR